MVEPGRYKHFKGAEYRVLFCIFWEDRDIPRDGAVVGVHTDGRDSGAEDVSAVYAVSATDGAALLLAPTWCGHAPFRGESIVVYVSLNGVFARTEREFLENVPHVPRFERIGP